MGTYRTELCSRFQGPLYDAELDFSQIEAGRLNQPMRVEIQINPSHPTSPHYRIVLAL